ncbi:MAG: DUF2330 domain-containing protein [Actinophytocola sp.]|uniref:DUF2330 domain-containing protein n=1 Tax=Actinophytocola sp. TaxID=1872138 RepID=UPI00132C95CE|nr:DUF2330 domain-containing protein [Actinophytocola sp.]MPZ82632.1 DUF2330 domain-containing protein [Actinophytocola sp.]
MRNTPRLLARALVLPVVALGLVGVGPGVAGACACGAVLADERLEATQETALVELAGATESVTLNITTRTQATEAAFIMPVPSRAAFELADAEVFSELDRISRPRVDYRDVVVDGDGTGGAANDGDHVTVTDHVDVGPYELAQLAGADSTAVTDWLADNDFTLPADLAGALTPYLSEGWLVVAVRLTPETEGTTFAEGLPPMRLTFGTDEPVYPMRLSATAEYGQPLRLYVLADHRMDASNPAPQGGGPELTYAGPLRPADVARYPILADMVTGQRFLTRFDATFSPDHITDDIHLTRAATDDSYRAVVVESRYVTGTPAGEVVLWALAGAGLLAVSALVVVAAVRRSRRP